FTLSGTECRQPDDCDFDVGGALQNFLSDGGILAFPDAGPFDAGFLDGGFVTTFPDGGFVNFPVDGGENFDGGVLDGGFVSTAVDGGSIETPVDGGPAPHDAGSVLDGLQSTL